MKYMYYFSKKKYKKTKLIVQINEKLTASSYFVHN